MRASRAGLRQQGDRQATDRQTDRQTDSGIYRVIGFAVWVAVRAERDSGQGFCPQRESVNVTVSPPLVTSAVRSLVMRAQVHGERERERERERDREGETLIGNSVHNKGVQGTAR